MDVSLVITGC